MPLQTTHRPDKLSDFVGNEALVESLTSVLAREKDKPHTFFFRGPSGCGKTTLGRIVANMVDCHAWDYHYFNASNTRGIETVRKVLAEMTLHPSKGKVKVYHFDECFAKDTIVETPNGKSPIQNMKVGDSIFSIVGETVIEKTFINKVDLERVVKLHFNNGTHTFTTKQHEYLTENGWLEAINLLNYNLTLCFDSDIMLGTNSLKEHKSNGSQNLSYMWKRIQIKKEGSGNLFKILCNEVKESKKRLWKIRDKALSTMWKRNVGQLFFPQETLFSKLCWEMEESTTRLPGEDLQQRSFSKNIQSPHKIQPRASRGCNTIIHQDERKQSNVGSKKHFKNEGGETNKRYSPHLDRKAWGEWAIHKTTDSISLIPRLGNGILSIFGQTEERVSNLLQSRYSKSGFKTWHRSRWRNAQIEKSYIQRCKENKDAKLLRVEDIEVYKRGYNDKSFKGIIGNKERDQGYVNFYDFQIKGHPSYFANGCPVHNCHQLTGPAQEAFLRDTEEPPDHVYFIFSTTEPEKMKVTFKRRGHQAEVKSLTQGQILKLLKQTLRKEKVENFPEKIISKIGSVCNGSPGLAMSLLDSVIDIADDELAFKAIEEATLSESAVNQLCQTLLDPRLNFENKWSLVRQILKALPGEPETNRRAVLNYMTKVMLSKDNPVPEVFEIMAAFFDNYFYSGKAGLVASSYLACKSGGDIPF